MGNEGGVAATETLQLGPDRDSNFAVLPRHLITP